MPPTRLLAALARVQSSHPVAASGFVHESPELIERWNQRLDELLAMSAEGRVEALRQLSPNHVRLLAVTIRGRLGESAVLRLLQQVQDAHPGLVDGLLALEGWLLLDEPCSLSEPAFGWIGAKGGPPWTRLRRAVPPLSLIREDYLKNRAVWQDSEWHQALEGLRLNRVVRQFKKSALLGPSLRMVAQREEHGILHQWSKECLLVGDRDRWLALFLNETWRGSWPTTHPVLSEIYDRFGRPRSHSFWQGVGDEGAAAFIRWCNDHELTRLLGEEARVSFWRRFLGAGMESVVPTIDSQAVLIVFQDVVAVQFIEMGRATYFFDRSQIRQMRRLHLSDLYEHVLTLNKLGLARGRYEHRGNFWEVTAESVVRRVLGLR